jgi:Sap, sulfolipid-1-addressing protein
MNAAFFGLACLAALNPKLLVIDLILATNQRPRLMFMFFLLGGIGLGLTIGLLDVLVLQVDAIKTQNHVSGGLDLALGIPLLAIGALLAADHLRIFRRRAHPPLKDRPPPKLAVWVQRVLHEPRYGLAVLIGAAVGTPGASYLIALHHLINTKTATAVAVVAVIVFVLINWAPVLVPFASLEFRPQGTEKALKRFMDWLTGHERQIAAGVALLAGGYMVISGLVRALS